MQTAIAKVFTSGNGQSICLPSEFWLDAHEVLISKSGNSLILTPRMDSWSGFAEGFSGFSEDFSVTDGPFIDTPRRSFE